MIFYIDIALLLVAAVALARRKEVELHAFDREATVPLRAILALFVIFEHVAIWEPLKLGTAAVSVFLFMSGYGMYKSYEKKGAAYLRHFEWNHAVRLFVPFVCCAAVWIPRMYLGNRLHGKTNYGWQWVWNAVCEGDMAVILPYSWFPIALFALGIVFVAAFRIKREVIRLIGVVLGVIAVYATLRFCLEWPEFWWVTLWAFGVGLFYARHELFFMDKIRLLRWKYPTILVCALIALNLTGVGVMVELTLALTGVVFVTVLYVLPLPRWGWLLWLGGVSYEIYLTHGMIYNVLTQVGVCKYLVTVITLAVTPLFAYGLQWGVVRLMAGWDVSGKSATDE